MLLHLLASALLPLLANAQFVQVTSSFGTVNGFHVDLGSNKSNLYYGQADVFLGIPFVEAPVGNRRFKLPAALHSYGSTPVDATQYKPACPQTNKDFPTSEDCLYINVITPDASRRTDPFPVMFYIHGGSLIEGSGRELTYQGAIRNYASRGVVVVTIQYRIGLLGFFSTGTREFPANLGMLDQIEALKWVQLEIANYGGDPSRVTVLGNSAGAISISAHSYSPLSQNLFTGAILQSGSVLTMLQLHPGFTGTSEKYAYQLCNFTAVDLDAGNVRNLQTCLGSMDPSAWLQYEASNLQGWKIIVDDFFLPDLPVNLAATRPKIPIMYGTEKDEYCMLLFALLASGQISFGQIGRPLWQMQLHALMSDLPLPARLTLQSILESYYLPAGTADNDSATWMKTMSDAFTGGVFVSPIHEDIRQMMRYKNDKIFVYEQSYGSRMMRLPAVGTWQPAMHTQEMLYVNCNPANWNTAIALGLVDARDYELLDWTADAWSNFAKTANPGWAPVTPTSGKIQYLDIGASGNTVQPEYRAKDEYVWRYVVNQHIGETPA